MSKSLIKRINETVISLFFPRRCPICDEPVKPFGALACEACAKKVRYVHGATCYKCGKPLSDNTTEYCEDCSRHGHLYTQGMALFEYKSVSDSIYRFKYKGRREYADWYGERIVTLLGNRIVELKPDVLVPVPVHKSKLKKRGYNQAALIAKVMSEYLKIPCADRLIEREKKTTPLKDLTPRERNNILRGAFKLKADVVKLDTIVIIDDIYTTGATIDAIADVFLQAGVKKIYFVALGIGKGV